MFSGTWKWNVLDRKLFAGHRVKRVENANPGVGPFIYKQGMSSGSSFNSAFPTLSDPTPPPKLPYNGDNYYFGFWSMTAVAKGGAVSTASVSGDRKASLSLNGGPWMLTANAWYFWDQGAGPGAHGILLDAFDIQANDFIANDFVAVAPDDTKHTLQNQANNGFLDTSAFTAKQIEVITALDLYPAFYFDHWQTVDQLAHAGDGVNFPSVNLKDITCRQNDIMLSVAMYNEIPNPTIGPIYATNPILIPGFTGDTPGVVFVPLGGGGPVGPDDPFSQIAAAVRIFQDAQILKGKLRADALKIAQQSFNAAVKDAQKLGKLGR